MQNSCQIVESLSYDFHPSALADIYQETVNMAIWKRNLDTDVFAYAKILLQKSSCFQTRFTCSSSNCAEKLEKEIPLNKHRDVFISDVALLVDMFSCLFELKRVGLRMAVLNTAMCPKFHVDRVPCRMISTYAGATTQWHPHEEVRRIDDGVPMPLADAKPRSLEVGDVALLKGESWEGNEGRGLVHRSPLASDIQRRLVLTLDFA